MSEAVIEAVNLTKYYGKSRGIIDLNLKVREGDIFGFIGPNGAGKSTTIRILLGLISATSGSGTVFGRDIVKDKERILEDIGYMPSEAMFYSGMKVWDIIKFSAELHKKHRAVEDSLREARDICERLELDTSKKSDELSLGNRKKVSVVCAMQHKPKLYILDEPTSGLDPLMQKEFFSLIRERNKEGATIFLSSHVLSEIQRYCNYAAIIREGKIIVRDSVEALSKTSAKRVNLHGNMNDIKGIINHMEGVKGIQTLQDSAAFLFGGDINILLKELSGIRVSDVSITEPDLDEIFMHYYGSGVKDNDNI